MSTREDPYGWEMQMLHPSLCTVSWKTGRTKDLSAFLSPWKDERVFLKVVFIYLKNKDVIGKNQCEFAKANYSWPMWYLFVMRCPTKCIRGEQWMFFIKDLSHGVQAGPWTEVERLIYWWTWLLFIDASTCWRTMWDSAKVNYFVFYGWYL